LEEEEEEEDQQQQQQQASTEIETQAATSGGLPTWGPPQGRNTNTVIPRLVSDPTNEFFG